MHLPKEPLAPTAARPSLFLSTGVVLFLTALWGYLRLGVFGDTLVPLSFVLPLLVCVWTRRPWQLWSMAAAFAIMAIIKIEWILPDLNLNDRESRIFLATTWFNTAVGAVIAQAILSLRHNLESRNATISAQNSELEAQAEELSQQNEEIKAQSEELAEQNEEIETQAEEVTRQNEDLLELNTKLSSREEILQGLMQSFQQNASIPQMLDDLCQRALTIIGPPAANIAILEQKENQLHLLSDASIAQDPNLPEIWTLGDSIAGLVLREEKTAYVSDLGKRPDLAAPFGEEGAVRSILATPLTGSRGAAGLFAACSAQPAHWTEEQFRMIEWLAAQSGLMMEIFSNQKALEAHAIALEEANQAKDRFMAMLSHELRTPLTPVLAAAGALETDKRLPEDLREDLHMIRRNAGIQSRLIDDLLDLTRISRGKVELDRRVFSATTLVRDAARIVAGDLDAKSQKLDMDLQKLEDAAVFGDGPRLQQVFWNLLKNAAKFSDPGTTIHVRGKIENGFIAIEVQDEGRGIAPADLERIFLPFEQTPGGSQTKNGESGLGLGLAIAKSIIDMHGGTISAHSLGPDQGATFVIRLPTVTAETANAAHSHEADHHATLTPAERPRILLIEDHRDTGKILARLLQSAGYEVDYAENATRAWDLFQKNHFDIIVSDVGLPDESGIDLMRRMRNERPETRGICLSGYGMEEDIQACRDAGFSEHLTKPVEFGRLRSAVTRLLNACG